MEVINYVDAALASEELTLETHTHDRMEQQLLSKCIEVSELSMMNGVFLC